MKRSLIATVILCAAGLVCAADTTPTTIPPGEPQAKARLDASNRHTDYVDIKIPGSDVPLKTFIVHPERPDKAPVVIVIMEIYGLSDWLKATCDQLAADGFIAVAPDFISGKGPNGGGTEAFANRSDVTRAVSGLKTPDVMTAISAARDYALKLPSANGKYATMGFCWGGGQSFAYAANDSDLNAAVVFYGPPPADLTKVKAPIAGFYGGNDNRITATVAPTTDKMKALGKTYDPHIYEGAGHGFMRSQSDQRSADLKAAQQAWPIAIQFLRDNTK
jgi:carboxymethylenebutenolidase